MDTILTVINWFKVLILGLWVIGMFAFNPTIKILLWSMPAGYGAGAVIAEYALRKRVLKTYSSKDKDLPPEIEEAMKKIMESLKEEK